MTSRLPKISEFSLNREAYNFLVARGWESKSVEAQQAESSEKPQKQRPRLTLSEAAQQREAENLRLARVRILRQIESTASPRYRALLQESLKDIDRRLGQK
jgi:hypothetical protein